MLALPLAIVLFVWSPSSEPSAATGRGKVPPASPSSPRPTSATNLPPLPELASLESYYGHLELIKARFAELADFERRVVGYSVAWRGEARGVIDHDEGQTTLLIGTTNRNGWLVMAQADFPKSFRLRVLALSKVTPSVSLGSSGTSMRTDQSSWHQSLGRNFMTNHTMQRMEPAV